MADVSRLAKRPALAGVALTRRTRPRPSSSEEDGHPLSGVRHNLEVSSYGYLRAGSLVIAHLRNAVDEQLMLLFRDDMLDVRRVLASQYYTPAKGYESFSQSNDYEMDQVEYRAPGRTIAERLDLMGVTAEAALTFLDKNFNRNLGERSPSAQLDDDQRAILDTAHEENMRIILAVMTEEQLADYESAKELRESLDSHRWMELLASASEDGSFNLHPKLGSRESAASGTRIRRSLG